ncbi:major facilitator superfamily protein [Hirsutella rhossiliensis]|uniref:Major facilitator superfamily domain-containing protein n=1 Tax=Hirsutella rhossiliensis TaxID=111463 RepID=A0A9P8N124_9HYPO|nr:major facilitator superfamily domain-containing protein [Hirsutella rhossiliensis]KAH0964899.1 major facilitator superfamily domain-containing protein [Hirsutella rhossiliensis]
MVKAQRHHGASTRDTGAESDRSESWSRARPDVRSEKGRTRPAPASLDAHSPISYLYLTFDTLLPTLPAAEHGQQPPPCPDLRRLDSPLTWSPVRKYVLLAMSCTATFLTAYAAGSYSPPAAVMAQDFGTSRLVILVGITTFCLGFAIAPMALAPISEIWGRFPVFVAAGIVFVVSQVACSFMPNATGMLVARLLTGVGASVFSAVVGGVIADLWDNKDRNTPMALFSCAVLTGTGAGPLVATALVQSISNPTLAWKWVFWHQVIMDAVLVVAIFVLCKESRASVLLTKRAQLLNKWYAELEGQGTYGLWTLGPASMAINTSDGLSDATLGGEGGGDTPQSQLRRIRWLVREDEQRPPVRKMMTLSIQRPFHMLFTEPIVFCFSLWAAFSWGILYLSFSVVPFLYETDLDKAGRVYVAMIVAGAVATVVSIAQQQLLQHPQWRAHDDGFRLYFACVTAMFLPAGLFGAFMCPRYMDGYAEAVGLGFATCGIYSVYLATFNYLADAYGAYASSALAAQSCCRNIVGGGFPLLTRALFSNLGLRGAGGLLGGIATVLTITPWVLVFFGESVRTRSRFATDSLCRNKVAV